MAWGGPMVVGRAIVRILVNDERGEVPKNQNQNQLGEFSTKSPVNFYQTLCTQNSWTVFQYSYG